MHLWAFKLRHWPSDSCQGALSQGSLHLASPKCASCKGAQQPCGCKIWSRCAAIGIGWNGTRLTDSFCVLLR